MTTPFDTNLPAWEVRQEKYIADYRIFELKMRKYFHPSRQVEADFVILQAPDWVHAIPCTSDNKIVMVNQFRFGREMFSWELPGGLLDPGEGPIDGALREMQEETGYVGSNPRIIGEVSPNPAYQTNTQTFVYVENCQALSQQSWDTHEELQVGCFRLDEIESMIQHGHIHNAMVIAALFFLERAMR